jgi:hypothetical protein
MTHRGHWFVIELIVRTMMPRFAAVSPTTALMSIKPAVT